MGVGPDRLAFW